MYQGWVFTNPSLRTGLSFTDGPGEEGSGDTELKERKEAEWVCRACFLGIVSHLPEPVLLGKDLC